MLIIAAVVVVIVVSSGGGKSGPSYYLALGDSLSVGIQPTASGQQLKTDEGYVNDVYAHLKTVVPHITLKELGCPGDDTANVISGRGNTEAVTFYHCDRQGGSQLQAALNFIHAHRGQVKLVTVDIGANDINNCLNPTVFNQGLDYTVNCINQGVASIATNLPKILGPLKAAVAPGTALVGGQIYDPFLAGMLTQDATDQSIAAQSLALITRINSEIAYADANAGFSTADVGGAFQTYDTTKVSAPSLGGSAQQNVVTLCAYTWVCSKAPRGPNIHPNSTGYKAMARAFDAALPRTL